jgi:hypothetical protein
MPTNPLATPQEAAQDAMDAAVAACQAVPGGYDENVALQRSLNALATGTDGN